MLLEQLIEGTRTVSSSLDDAPERAGPYVPWDGPRGNHECIKALTPIVQDCLTRFGYEDTLAALLSLLVAKAVEWKRPDIIAQVLFSNAQLLKETAFRWEHMSPRENLGLPERPKK